MHKGIILLVEKEEDTEVLDAVKEFMGEYKNDVWDWYVIGGRWSGTLSPLYSEFMKRAEDILTKEDHGYVLQSTVDEKQPELQKIWEELKGKGVNPLSNHYELPDDGGLYDILPLSECIDTVKEWQQTIEDAKKSEQKAKEWLAEGGRKDKNDNLYDDWGMYGYCLSSAANLYQQNFCFDCNVFNIKSWDYSIPEDIDNYVAVMVDIHN